MNGEEMARIIQLWGLHRLKPPPGATNSVDGQLSWGLQKLGSWKTNKRIKKNHIWTWKAEKCVRQAEVRCVCKATLKVVEIYMCGTVPHRAVSYHCWCSTLCASPTSHSSGKLDVKMRNHCACRGLCSLSAACSATLLRNYSYKGHKTIRCWIASPQRCSGKPRLTSQNRASPLKDGWSQVQWICRHDSIRKT